MGPGPMGPGSCKVYYGFWYRLLTPLTLPMDSPMDSPMSLVSDRIPRSLVSDRIPRSLVQNTPTRCGNVFPTRETHSWELFFLSFFGTHFGIFGTHFDPHLYAHPDGFMGFWDPSRKIRNEKLCKTAVLMCRDL